MADIAVQATGLVKQYDGRWAVAGVDLRVPKGSLYGLVGPNGAGKTTSIRMMTGLLRPDGGQVLIGGLAVWPDPVAVKRRIGILLEDDELFGRLTAPELLEFVGLLRGMPVDTVRQRAQELLDVLGLANDAATLVVDFSHGMHKKVALAAALLHGPSVLFLDEPFEAVDPVSARAIRSLLDQHRRAGGTILMSSHVMELVEAMCDEAAVIHQGRVVASGTLDQVRGGDATLEDAFVRLVGAGPSSTEDFEWLGSSSD
ncbi:MAG TPA: ABC transporter ATP-binding protein [Acidimicrobiales bacterium]